MKRDATVRVLFGLMVVVFGGILLAHNLEIINITDWSLVLGILWGGLLIVASLLTLLRRRAWLWGLLLCMLGVLIVLNAFGIAHVGFWKFLLPAALIVLGLGAIFGQDSLRRSSISSSEASEEESANLRSDRLSSRRQRHIEKLERKNRINK